DRQTEHLERYVEAPSLTVRVPRRDERSDADAEQTAAGRERRRLDDELAGDVAAGRAARPSPADLPAPVQPPDHPHLGDADAADDERNGAEAEQQPSQTLVDPRPRFQRIGRP